MIRNPKYQSKINELENKIKLMQELIKTYKQKDLAEYYYKKSLGIES